MAPARLNTSNYKMFGTRGQSITVNWDRVEYITELFEINKDKTRKAVGTTIHFQSGQMTSVETEYRLVKKDMTFGR